MIKNAHLLLLPLILLVVTSCTESRPDRFKPKNQEAYSENKQQQTAAPKAVDDKFIITLLVPLTGEGNELGSAMLNSSMLALADQSRYLNISPEKVIIAPKDTRSYVAEAAVVMNEAISEGTDVILGPVFSNSLQEVLPLAQRTGVPVFSFSNNTHFAGKGIFLTGFIPDQQINAVLDYSYKKGKSEVAILTEGDAYGKMVVAAATNYTSNNPGIKIAAVAYYGDSGTGLMQAVRKIMDKGDSVDAILIPEGGAKLQAAVEALTASGVDFSRVKLLGSGQWDDDSTLRIPGVKGGWFASSEPIRRKKFEARYKEAYGSKPPRLASLAYDTTAMVLSYYAEGVSPNAMQKVLTQESGFIGPVDGPFKAGVDGTFIRNLAILEVSDGGFRVIKGQDTK